jgi:hypothetical protein
MAASNRRPFGGGSDDRLRSILCRSRSNFHVPRSADALFEKTYVSVLFKRVGRDVQRTSLNTRLLGVSIQQTSANRNGRTHYLRALMTIT